MSESLTACGNVQWYSSEGEDGGPDVGLSLGLGNGLMLYVGELANQTVVESGLDPIHGVGWWIALESDDGCRVVAAVADQEAAREFFDALTAALADPRASSTQEGK